MMGQTAMTASDPRPPHAAATAADERLWPLAGRFRDAALEAEFRDYSAPEWSRRLRVFALVAASLFVIFGWVDHRVLGWGPALYAMWGTRLALAAVALGVARLLARAPSAARIDAAASALMFAVAAFALTIMVVERHGVAREAPVTLLAVISFYVFIPARFAVQAGAGLAVSVAVLVIDRRWGATLGADGAAAAAQFAVCNLLGAHAAITSHLAARREFLALRHEQRHKRALQESVAALEKSNAELEQFAYVASHDLQSPLRNVISFAQLLQRRHAEGLDAKGGEYLETIVHSAGHMQQLIADLLAFSRIGRSRAESVPVDTGALLDEVRRELAARIDEKGAEVTHDDLPVVAGSPGELHQLLQNLVENGLKFQNGRAPRVHVFARPAEDGWEFSVRDNGIGIRPEHVGRIFKMFERLHDTEQYPGTGIGLAICKKIVEQHGGRIWVESESGAGSTFHFTLPARPAAAAAA
jgi:signal transduction histidine kinase